MAIGRIYIDPSTGELVGKEVKWPTEAKDIASKEYVDQFSQGANISLDTSNFDNILSSADDTVQKAFDTLDDHVHDARYYTKSETDNLLNGKADKVSGATANNFAGLDASGNLIDSGYNGNSFAPQVHDHDDRYYTKSQTDGFLNAKADKVSGATDGNFAALDANGNLTDSGYDAGDFAPFSHQHYEADIIDLEHDAIKIQGREVSGAAPADGDVLTWVAANNRWEPKAGGNGGTQAYKVLTPSDDLESELENAEDGDHFYLTPGTYQVSSTITITAENLTLDGSHSAVINANFTSATNLFEVQGNFRVINVSVNHRYNGYILSLQDGVSLTVVNCNFEGDSSNPAGYAVMASGNNKVLIARCRFSGNWSNGVLYNGATTNQIIVRDCWLDSSSARIQPSHGMGLAIIGCRFNGSTIEVTGGSAGIQILYNRFYGVQGDYAIEITASGGALIAGNRIKMGSNYRAIYITGGGDYQIVNNYIETSHDGMWCQGTDSRFVIKSNIVYTTGSSGYGIYCYTPASAIIEGNYFRCADSSNSAALYFYSPGSYARNAIISNNTFDGRSLNATGKTALYVYGGLCCTITGNRFIGSSTAGFAYGIYCYATDAAIVGNTFHYCPAISGTGYAIGVNTSYCKVADNGIYYSAGGQYAIRVGAAGCTIVNNTIRGNAGTGIYCVTTSNLRILGNYVYRYNGTAIDAANVSYSIIKNNLYYGNANLPADGSNGNIVKDNIDRG